MRMEVGLHEGALDQRLTVIKHAVHLQCGDVAAQGGELALLDGAHLAFGIEHIHMYALYAQESVGYGRTRVAAGGHQHVHQSAVVGLVAVIAQQAGHKACAHVLECQGGAMEELEAVDAVGHAYGRHVERERVAHDLLQRVGRDVFAEEGLGHARGYLVERKFVYLFKERCGQGIDALGHVEAAVFGQAFHHGFFKGGERGLVLGAVIVHCMGWG